MSFSNLGVPADLAANLAARGILSPFPIQESTLPDSLAGHDICGKAPTGSGKTLAFSIPMAAVIGDIKGHPAPKRPRGLVLVPTRELAAQVEAVVKPLADERGCRTLSVYGGVGFDAQLRALRRGVDIVVACPGRLIDLMERGAIDLRDVSFVVIDEADRMADMGFLPGVRRILDQTRRERQTLLFSATLDGDVDKLIRSYQKNPKHFVVELDEDDEDTRLHIFWKVQRDQRVALCADVARRFNSTVVFTRTKRGADRLRTQLRANDVRASVIHGDRSQAQRDRALAEFTSGHVPVLVATDVAARGIHVEGVDCVIHYDIAEDDKTYIHRSGRTARAGAGGTVVSLVDPSRTQEVVSMQRRLQMAAGVVDANMKALPAVISHADRERVREASGLTELPVNDQQQGRSRGGRGKPAAGKASSAQPGDGGRRRSRRRRPSGGGQRPSTKAS